MRSSFRQGDYSSRLAAEIVGFDQRIAEDVLRSIVRRLGGDYQGRVDRLGGFLDGFDVARRAGERNLARRELEDEIDRLNNLRSVGLALVTLLAELK